MATDYALNTFLRQTPNALLAEYFRRQGVLGDVHFARLKKTEYEPILAAMEKLAPDVRARIESDFQSIALLANRAGTEIILDEAQLAGLDLADTFASMENHYHRAMWLFLNADSLNGGGFFECCLMLAQVRQASFPASRRLLGLPRRTPERSTETLHGMAAALREFYRPQGRGQRCSVEYNMRPSPTQHYYVAYPEDYATTDLEYAEDALNRRPRRSVFQVSFIFHEEEGMLEISAPSANKRQVQTLQQIFCRYALDMIMLPTAANVRAFNLNLLKNPDFAFPTEPTDGIERVELLALRLDDTARRRRIMFEGSPDESIHSWLNGANAHLVRMMEVSSAKLRLVWGAKKTTHTFTITLPDRISPHGHKHTPLVKRYLKAWGLQPWK